MGRTESRQIDAKRRPQLYGDSAAARQARRAAGVFVDGDDPKFVENEHPKTNFISVRALIRKAARRNGAPARVLSEVSKWARGKRREALGESK